MFDTLLESRATRKRSAGGTVASVTAHSALIAAAVFATAQARVEKPRQRIVVVDYFARRPVVTPPQSQATERASSKTSLPKLVDIDLPASRLPSFDVSTLPAIGDRLAPVIPAAHPAGPQRTGWSGEPTGAFHENEVEKPVSLLAGSAPRYPELLRASGVEGRVVAVFVVDEKGRAEMDSVRFVGAGNSLFQDAVRAALPRMQFVPAEIAGQKVRQLVQMPFVFTIDR
jgi:periplasmic protein TonB